MEIRGYRWSGSYHLFSLVPSFIVVIIFFRIKLINANEYFMPKYLKKIPFLDYFSRRLSFKILFRLEMILIIAFPMKFSSNNNRFQTFFSFIDGGVFVSKIFLIGSRFRNNSSVNEESSLCSLTETHFLCRFAMLFYSKLILCKYLYT